MVREKLLTPYGLRSLAPGHPDYQPQYCGDLRARDLAYHQGTVWPWLIGPFVDAWRRVYPDRVEELRPIAVSLGQHLASTCVGSISEIFDAEPPYTPRGCCAQAWSVAEALRLKTVLGEPPRPQSDSPEVAGPRESAWLWESTYNGCVVRLIDGSCALVL